MTDDWPSHTAELSRKTVEAVNDMMFRYGNGEISAEAAFVGLGAMFDVVSGLVEREVMDLLTLARAEVKPKTQRRLFAKTAGADHVELVMVSTGPRLVSIRSGKLGAPRKKEIEDDGDAANYRASVAAALKAKGFEELK